MVICTIVTSFCNYLSMVVSASNIHVASLTIKSESKKIREDNPQLISSYLRFLQNCDEEISMSVGGLFDVKRNVILGSFGTILTYTLLFRSILTEKKVAD